jgi:hypothetical protein
VTVTDNAVTVVSAGNAPAQALLGGGATGVGQVLGNIGQSFNAAATGTSLAQDINVFAADPFPLLHQVISDQAG